MASEQTVLDYFGKALWDPHPTKTDLRARQLAVALGYPPSFRVVRTLEESPNAEGKTERCIVDRIYSGKPGTGCDCWFHHEAAMKAAETWVEEESTPFQHKGGHLLPRQPLFGKGDKVQVMYNGEWWDATILRKKEDLDGFRYGVHYPADSSKQSGVEESLIRRRPQAKDPKKVAASLGFGEGWEAVMAGSNKWRITSRDGYNFTSKKKALEYYKDTLARDSEVGDPPWRTTGSEYLQKRLIFTTEHKASARRSVKVEQVGKVVGWISETDVDKAGEPGFVSEQTGKPARLYHVEFEEEPHHPYVNLLVQSQDLEEDELLGCLLSEEEAEPAKKKSRKR